MNQAIVIGNLGADAEVKESNGQKFISMSIADTRKYKRQDGTEVSSTQWVDAIIGNVNHPVLPFLKQGVKVCVIGAQTLRVYSSKKDRMMKAGMTIHVSTIELCGGSSDEVPRQLIDPNTGQVWPTQKFYWVNRPMTDLMEGESLVMIDSRGNEFSVTAAGWVSRVSCAHVAEEGQDNATVVQDDGDAHEIDPIDDI